MRINEHNIFTRKQKTTENPQFHELKDKLRKKYTIENKKNCILYEYEIFSKTH